MIRKINEHLMNFCLGLMSLAVVSTPVYAIESSNTTKPDVQIKEPMIDVVIPGEPEPIPADGDSMNLNVGWSNSGYGYYYCKDESRVKVTGWQQINGKWYFFDPMSYVMKRGWLNYEGKWYYLLDVTHVNEKFLSPKYGLLGTMQTGWIRDNNKNYYFNQNGVMQTGWVQDNGKWYYFNQDGSMATDTIVDGYNIGSDGAWIRN